MRTAVQTRNAGKDPLTFPIGGHPRYRRLRRALVVCTALLFASPFVLRWLDVGIPRAAGFRGVMILIVLANLAWWSFADEALVSLFRRRRSRAAIRIGLAAGLGLVLGPILVALVFGKMPDLTDISTLAASGFQLWHMGLCALLPPVTLIGYLVYGSVSAIRRLSGVQRGTVSKALPPEKTVRSGTLGVSRRELLKAAGIYAPVILLGGTAALRGGQTGRFAVHRHDVASPWLPERLRGLTLTQVSDLHLGRLYRPAMLPRLVDAVNRLDSDIVCVTGDVVDLSNDLLPAAIEAFKQLEHRHGLFFCLGNHDLIDNREAFVNEMLTKGFDLLIDERRRLEIGGERITVAGLDWSRRDSGHSACARAALAGHDPEKDGPCIALAHHPHAFDALADAGVPLTLSGHTHGGQLMLRAPHADGRGDPDRDVGVGRMLFRYLRGFYHREGKALFVNSGVGNWFPIRLNAPAEIVQLRLV